MNFALTCVILIISCGGYIPTQTKREGLTTLTLGIEFERPGDNEVY